ncbi:FadR/GntR family transcriptional regulator [Vibrio sp. TH_r3]|uniref:FadR/GntR family transcriptional regulator n=1 Tax=Vibrio sp. TH_r3 TaxID=3082084 RepID=UPI0029554B7E|nr:FadR/GntR family transcriptional regulator [Vibrio sp. TH_r3]MDV7105358.1 FadR/GntR family transcriptional regulator [Vibrio sp. TH_r3]
MSNNNSKSVKSMASIIYEKILSCIIDDYEINSKLPTEAKLSETYGVSRTIIREALTRLKEDGLVVSRRGSGNFVIQKPESTVLKFAAVSSILDIQRCFEFRIHLESGAARLAAGRRTEQQLKNLIAASEAIYQANKNNNLATDDDYRFHYSVAMASNNEYYTKVFSSLQDNIRQGMNLTRTLSLHSSNKRFEIAQKEHEEIVQAIIEQDEDAAELAMRTHLRNARIRMFEGL